VQAALFLVAGALAVALLVGYRTRFVVVLSWVLLVSLHARNPLVLNSGDSVLRRLLLWGAFLPLGARWSLDALRSRRGGRRDGDTSGIRGGDGAPGPGDTPRRRVATLASAALLLQVVLIYVLNLLFKLRGDVWLEGDAIRYAFGLDSLTVGLGNVLAGHPELLVVLGWLWMAMLACSPLLLLLTGRARTALVVLFAGMHAGMALTLRIGLFPVISMAALLPFLPPPVWDRLEARAERVAATLDRRFGVERALAPPSGTRPTIGVAMPRVSLARWRRRLATAVVAVLLTLMLVWNAMTLGYVPPPGGDDPVVDTREYRWDMFAPTPTRVDFRYVVPADLESGRQVDAFHGGDVTWDRPPDLAAAYPSMRWYRHLKNLRSPGYAPLREPFADYLCRRWNRTHDDGMVRLTVTVVEEPTRLEDPEETRRVELLGHSCSAGG